MTRREGVRWSPPAQRLDITVAGVTTAISLALLLLMPLIDQLDADLASSTPHPSDALWWIAASAVTAQGVCLLWVSTRPHQVVVVVPVVALLASIAPLGSIANITLVALVPAAYVAARRRTVADPWYHWAIALLLAVGAGLLTTLRDPEATLALAVGSAALQALLMLGVPFATASAIRGRAAIYQAREREAVARIHEHEARTQAALADERTAIARELHDIAAHHLSGIALMSSAISQQIDSDPAGAKASLLDVRTQTRTLLDELRALVALLRQDEGAAIEVESIAAVVPLVAATKERGLDVTLSLSTGASIETIARGIGPLGQFAAYRTVQEALANAARHASQARCDVTLDDGREFLEIVVTNGAGPPMNAASPSRGFGLQGMTERAALTRSRLTYGPTDDNGWRVALRVPRERGVGALAIEEGAA